MSNINNLINNNIDIKEKKYALILGETPSEGARSPDLWKKAYKRINKDTKMYPADINPKNLSKVLSFLKKSNDYIGGSVTAPFKEKVIKFLDKVDNDSKRIGSVNTIIKKKNLLIGFNTDYLGCLETLKKIPLKKENNILIIGCGGAGKACIIASLNYYKDCNFFVFNRNIKKIKIFIKKIKTKNNRVKIIKNYKQLLELKKIHLVINTSSAGFNSWININNKYLNLKFFTPFCNLSKIKMTKTKDSIGFQRANRQIITNSISNANNFYENNKSVSVFDIIYNPKKTLLLKLSKINRNKLFNGLLMNLMQAVQGFMLVNKVKSISKIKIYKAMK